MKSQTCPKVVIFAIIIVFFFPVVIQAQRENSCSIDKESRNKMQALKLKIAAIISILLAGSMGICIPILGKRIPALKPEKDLFFIVKSFAAGVILATGLVHILPDAFDNLTSPCLKENPWGNFPFSGFICMVSAIATLMVDTFATSYYKKSQTSKASLPVNDGEVQVEMHTHASHGHAHGAILSSQGHMDGFSNHGVESSEFLRHRVISQVLELGILVHSVIIGVSLGTSENPATIKPLVAALSFHQFFEGAGLGGCIVQAKFKGRAMAIMALFFSLTTPFGIALGIGISSVYNENSPTALIVEGIFNSSASGILIYMALVDLLAADFMHPRMQDNGKLQVWANISLLMGSGLMSLMAKWA